MQTTTGRYQAECTNNLIRREISAIETYDQIIEKFRGKALESSLREMREDHLKAWTILQQHVATAQQPAGSGAWGAWAKFTAGAAKMFGDKAALKALKEGEEHGVKDYEDAIRDHGIDDTLREAIESSFIPQQRKHIASLSRMITQ